MQEPQGENRAGIARQNREAIGSNFETLLEQLATAGVLEGIAVSDKMPFISAFSIDGPKENIERLRQYLKESGIGNLMKNIDVEAIE